MHSSNISSNGKVENHLNGTVSHIGSAYRTSTAETVSYSDDLNSNQTRWQGVPKLILTLVEIIQMNEILEDGHKLINWMSDGKSVSVWDFDYLVDFHFKQMDPKSFRHRLNSHSISVTADKEGIRSKSFILRQKEGFWYRDNPADWSKISYKTSKSSCKQVEKLLAEKAQTLNSDFKMKLSVVVKERDFFKSELQKANSKAIFYKNRCEKLEAYPGFPANDNKTNPFSPQGSTPSCNIFGQLTTLYNDVTAECERVGITESDNRATTAVWSNPISDSKFERQNSTPNASPIHRYEPDDNILDNEERKIRDSYSPRSKKQKL